MIQIQGSIKACGHGNANMPSTSLKQHKFMEAVANNPVFAKKAGVPQSVGQDFAQADKGKSFSKGSGNRADVQSINSPKTNHGEMAVMKKGGDTMASKMNPGFMAMMAKKKAGAQMPMKKGGATKKMAGGGMTEATMGKVRTNPGNINGVADKGKTKGTVIKMKSDGKPLGMKKGGRAC